MSQPVDLSVMKAMEYQNMLNNVNREYLEYLETKGGKVKPTQSA